MTVEVNSKKYSAPRFDYDPFRKGEADYYGKTLDVMFEPVKKAAQKSLLLLAIAGAMATPAFAADRLLTEFPKFDSFHAHTEVIYQVPKPIGEVYDKIDEIVTKNKDTAVPPGNYTLVSHKKDNFVWG